ncbi:MAG TPA: tetratricopeptide repeat protein [Bdellovibrionales bacterium]|nr:tetratricopeptide repeat protein [Bdellovibrionales bacterium]
MKRIFTLVSMASIGVALTGCLQTRDSQKEQDEKVVLRKQVQNLQQTTADVNERFQDLEEGQRRAEGRLEAIENKVGQSQNRADQSVTAIDGKLKENDAAYREEFQKLSSEIAQLKLQIAELQAGQKRAAQQDSAVPSAADSFDSGEKKFAQKNWQEAILDFERYRKAYPKGRRFGAATLRIGQSFAELGLKDEARAFYEEVVAKFPKSQEAKTASAKLKTLKK